MNCCNRDMRRVGDGLLRQVEGGFQSTCQIDDFVGKVEKRQPFQSGHALARRLRIARRGFVQNELGDVNVELGQASRIFINELRKLKLCGVLDKLLDNGTELLARE